VTRPDTEIRSELAAVVRLRDFARHWYGMTSDPEIFFAAVYEYAVADVRAARLEDELRAVA
jgi:hypothetical protein